MKRTIMKNAWRKVREMKSKGWTGSTSMMLSMALKEAWREVKCDVSVKIDVDALQQLKGSEKQVAWATSIRNNFVVSLNTKLEKGDINFMDVEEVYYNGLGVYLTNDAVDISAYDKKLIEVKHEHPELSFEEQMHTAEQYVKELYKEADNARKNAKNKAKAEGKSIEQAKEEGKKALVKKIAPFLKEWIVEALNGSIAIYASQWIAKYKYSEYDTFYSA